MTATEFLCKLVALAYEDLDSLAVAAGWQKSGRRSPTSARNLQFSDVFHSFITIVRKIVL